MFLHPLEGTKCLVAGKAFDAGGTVDARYVLLQLALRHERLAALGAVEAVPSSPAVDIFLVYAKCRESVVVLLAHSALVRQNVKMTSQVTHKHAHLLEVGRAHAATVSMDVS